MFRVNVITISFVGALVILFCLVSCDPKRAFEKNQEIKDNSWYAEAPLDFEVEMRDTIRPYNFYINVRNAGFYGFSNIFLFVNTRFPDGKLERDTVECTLASPEGKWLGDGSGDIWDNRILMKKNIRFPQSGFYHFQLIQAMRINPLQGIMDAGIRIEKGF